jgi:hypothetical protein
MFGVCSRVQAHAIWFNSTPSDSMQKYCEYDVLRWTSMRNALRLLGLRCCLNNSFFPVFFASRTLAVGAFLFRHATKDFPEMQTASRKLTASENKLFSLIYTYLKIEFIHMRYTNMLYRDDDN